MLGANSWDGPSLGADNWDRPEKVDGALNIEGRLLALRVDTSDGLEEAGGVSDVKGFSNFHGLLLDVIGLGVQFLLVREPWRCPPTSARAVSCTS